MPDALAKWNALVKATKAKSPAMKKKAPALRVRPYRQYNYGGAS
jgi:hypothetical protein